MGTHYTYCFVMCFFAPSFVFFYLDETGPFLMTKVAIFWDERVHHNLTSLLLLAISVLLLV